MRIDSLLNYLSDYWHRPRMKKNIILVGLMGAGKSTIGRYLAKRQRSTFYDSDSVIVQRTGVPISTIFDLEGEQGFRDREEQIIAELCDYKGIVLATGGGSVIRQANRDKIKASGTVIYLRSSADTLYSRIAHDKKRPLMQTENPLQTLKDLLHTREPYYMEVADIVVNTGRQKVSSMIVELVRKIKQVEESS